MLAGREYTQYMQKQILLATATFIAHGMVHAHIHQLATTSALSQSTESVKHHCIDIRPVFSISR